MTDPFEAASSHETDPGAYVPRVCRTPWCKGYVWSYNSAPGVCELVNGREFKPQGEILSLNLAPLDVLVLELEVARK